MHGAHRTRGSFCDWCWCILMTLAGWFTSLRWRLQRSRGTVAGQASLKSKKKKIRKSLCKTRKNVRLNDCGIFLSSSNVKRSSLMHCSGAELMAHFISLHTKRLFSTLAENSIIPYYDWDFRLWFNDFYHHIYRLLIGFYIWCSPTAD